MSIHIEHLLVELLNNTPAPAGSTLWIADEALSPAELQAGHPREGLTVLSNRYDLAMTLRKAGHEVQISDFDFSSLPVREYSNIIYRVSKERPLVHHCINQANRHLCEGGKLHLIGTKDEGIRTHGRHAEQAFGTPEHAKKHGDAYHVCLVRQADADARPLDSKHYDELRTCTVGDFHFLSKPGVFGWNKVDTGSALLAGQVNRLLERRKSPGSVLDLGCGYGYLLLATANLHFSKRVATDNNAAAVDAARAGFARANLPVEVTLDDCGEQLQEPFDWILCNPPFHQGFETSNGLTEKFLQQIRRLLAPQGQALVVVNQFIPIERLAGERFARVDILCHEHGFKVVQLS